jgi:hypothetical protein
LKSDRFNTHTQTEVNDNFSELINAAPEAMGTLFELAKAVGHDKNYAVNIQNQLHDKENAGVCYSIAHMEHFLNGLTAGLNNRVLNSVVYIEGKFNNISSDDTNVLQIQRFDESFWVDVAKFIVGPLLTSSKVIMNEIAILEILGSKNVYTKEDTTNVNIAFVNIFKITHMIKKPHIQNS